MLYSSVYLSLKSGIINMLLDIGNDPLDISIPLGKLLIYLRLEILVHIRHEVHHGQVIQLDLNLADTKSVCDRRIYIHGLSGLLYLLLR